MMSNRNHLRLTLVFTLVSSLLLTIFNPVMASASETKISETAKGILQYGPDGGITFTISLVAQSIITYSGASGSTITFSQSDSNVRIPPGYSYGASACGTQINVRNYTSMSDPFKNSTIKLPYTSSYWTEPGTVAISGKNSGSDWSRQIGGTFTATFQNEGYAQPTPSKCFGGGTASNTLTFSN